MQVVNRAAWTHHNKSINISHKEKVITVLLVTMNRHLLMTAVKTNLSRPELLWLNQLQQLLRRQHLIKLDLAR